MAETETRYDKLMRDIIDYIAGTKLAQTPITGCSADQIAQAEETIGKKLPPSLVAWYRHMGENPPSWNDYDADFSIRDLTAAQETARKLTSLPECQWTLTEQILPFSQRIGEQFLFVDMSSDPVDPPVYHYMECEPDAQPIDIAFSVHIREGVLEWLDTFRPSEYMREIGEWREKPNAEWLKRKHILDALYAEADEIRKDLLETVHDEDIAADTITSPRAFQERWIAEFSSTETWVKFQKEGLRMHFGWITPPPTMS
jgi:hypothetical protein